MAEKPYALILYGATGFTGRLAAQYLAKQYASGGFRWAVAGRSKEKLEALRQQCGGIPEVVIADSGDAASIRAMVQKTKVLLTCAGPFARYGSPIVAACAELGVDYCDITGETNWVREMIQTHDDAAQKSGARIVHHCGHDSIPWDLMVLMLTKKLREANPQESLAHVELYDEIDSQASGGTLETAVGILYGPESKVAKKGGLGYDALLKSGDKASSAVLKAQNVGFLELGKGQKPHRAWFIMSAVNANAVRRSNALKKYGERVTYREGQAFTSVFAAVCYLLSLGLLGLGLAIPPLRWLLREYVLPKPGEGPSEERMARGFLTVTGEARGTLGGRAKATIHFPTDPGYKDTARMLVESGLALALGDGLKKQVGGGVFTPAACQGEALLERLLATGTTFAYHDQA